MKKLLMVYSPHENYQTGAPQTMARLIKNIDKSKFEINVLVQKNDLLVEELERNKEIKVIKNLMPDILNVFGKKLLRGGMKIGFKRYSALKKYKRDLKGELERINPDLIWCLNWRGVVTVAPVAKKIGVPVAYQIGLGIKSKKFYTFINEILLSLSTKIIIESKHQIGQLYNSWQQMRFKEKFVVLPFGIDMSKLNPGTYTERDEKIAVIGEDDIIIGAIGSLTKRKGFEDLIEAVGKIKSDKEIHLVIIGGDPDKSEKYYNYLVEKINQLSYKGNIHLVGWQKNVPEWLDQFDIFVMPSLGEGISVALREAMAMSLPIIVTDVGGAKDAIKHMENGMLTEVQDSEKLAEKIQYLINNPENADKMGKQARIDVVEKFSVDVQTRKYEEEFEKIIQDSLEGR